MTFRKALHLFRTLVAWLIAPAIIVVVYGELTHVPVLQEVEINIWDKALHFTAYFGLALMATIAVRADRRTWLWIVALIVMGEALEIIQGMTGRDSDIHDEIANSLGVLTGAALAWAGIALLKARKLVEGPPAD